VAIEIRFNPASSRQEEGTGAPVGLLLGGWTPAIGAATAPRDTSRTIVVALDLMAQIVLRGVILCHSVSLRVPFREISMASSLVPWAYKNEGCTVLMYIVSSLLTSGSE
jgi:hypothetical protein